MEHAESVAPVPFPERTSVRRERTTEAAWKGLAASLLLHLFVGGAVVVVLTGTPKAPPQVVDLTLLPATTIGRSPVRQIFLPAAERKRDDRAAVLAEPPALPGLAGKGVSPDVSKSASSRAAMAMEGIAPADGAEPLRSSIPDPLSSHDGAAHGVSLGADAPSGAGTGEIGSRASTGTPSGTSRAGIPATGFAWIRDAIQRTIAYPATARRMGWEGKVVVAFRLLSDGSVRNVRVVQGSGHTALDRGAIDAVRNASPFPRSPGEAEVITPVVYRLTPGR